MHKIALEIPYSDFIAMRDSEETKIGYAGDLGRFRDWSGVEPWKATRQDISKYFAHLIGKELAHISIKRSMSAMFKFYQYLSNTLDETSIYHRIDDPSLPLRDLTLKSDEPNPKALNMEQRKVVLDSLIWDGPNATIKEVQTSLAVFVAFKTGLRRFEIAKLRWEDLDLDQRTFYALRKGKKKFYGNISGELLVKLKDYQLFTSKVDTDWVFFNARNPSKHLDKSSIGKMFEFIKKRVGFNKSVKFSTHVGRHVFCTTLHEKGVPDIEAIKMSGHKSVGMFSRYVKNEDELIKSKFNSAID